MIYDVGYFYLTFMVSCLLHFICFNKEPAPKRAIRDVNLISKVLQIRNVPKITC